MPDKDEEPEDAEEDEDEQEKLTGEAKNQSKQLDSITDFVEEKEGAKIDVKEVEARLKELREKKEKADQELADREKKLAAVKIKKEDLDLMCGELPLCEREALERVLRQNDGDLVAALRAAVKEFPRCT